MEIDETTEPEVPQEDEGTEETIEQVEETVEETESNEPNVGFRMETKMTKMDSKEEKVMEKIADFVDSAIKDRATVFRIGQKPVLHVFAIVRENEGEMGLVSMGPLRKHWIPTMAQDELMDTLPAKCARCAKEGEMCTSPNGPSSDLPDFLQHMMGDKLGGTLVIPGSPEILGAIKDGLSKKMKSAGLNADDITAKIEEIEKGSKGLENIADLIDKEAERIGETKETEGTSDE